jgi:hypothetical protein
VLAVMDVMGVNHPLQVISSFFGKPFNALVNNYIMKNKIKNAIANNTNAYGENINTVKQRGRHNHQRHGRNTEYDRKQIIPFKRVRVYAVV